MIPQPIEQSEQIKLPRATKAKSKKGTMGLQQVRSVGDVGMIEVDNPAEAAERAIHPKIWAERSLRDPLAKLHHTKRIDDFECRAGRMMQALLEAAEVGKIGSIDPSREGVDGGNHMPPIMNQHQLDALKTLNRLWPVLGTAGETLIRAVLAHGMMPEDYARALGMTKRLDIDSIGREFRRHLATLAKQFGLAS